MANNFKSYTLANVGTATSSVYTVPSSTTSVIIGLSLANTTVASVTANVLVNKADSQDTVYLAKSLEVPDASFYEFNAGNKVILETGDILQVSSSSSSSVDVMLSVLEQT